VFCTNFSEFDLFLSCTYLLQLVGIGGVMAMAYSLAHPYIMNYLPNISYYDGNGSYAMFYSVGQSCTLAKLFQF